MAKANKRPIAVLMMDKLNKIVEFIAKMKLLVANIGDNPETFVTPNPPLIDVKANIKELEDAETAVRQRTIGAASTRNIKYQIVLNDSYTMLAYVQGLADAAPNELAAISIIELSGFTVKTVGTRTKPPLEAKNGALSGDINIVAKAVATKATYYWQQSTNGEEWADLPDTLVAKTKVSALTPGTLYYFRFAALTSEGETEWSDEVSLYAI